MEAWAENNLGENVWKQTQLLSFKSVPHWLFPSHQIFLKRYFQFDSKAHEVPVVPGTGTLLKPIKVGA